MLSADGSQDLTDQQKKQLMELREKLRNVEQRFSQLEDQPNIQAKKARITSPKKSEVVTEDSMDYECDLPTPDYVPLNKHRDNAEDSGVTEETDKQMDEIKHVEAEKKEILSVKPGHRTEEQIKQLKALNYKLKNLKKNQPTNVPTVDEEPNKLMTDLEHAEAEKQEILSVKPQLRTKQQMKQLKALNYKLTNLKKNQPTNVPPSMPPPTPAAERKAASRRNQDQQTREAVKEADRIRKATPEAKEATRERMATQQNQEADRIRKATPEALEADRIRKATPEALEAHRERMATREALNRDRLRKRVTGSKSTAQYQEGMKTAEILSGDWKVSELCNDQDSLGKMDTICKHCGARKWSRETPSLCCCEGKVKLDRFPELMPQFQAINNLLFGRSRESRLGREHIRSLNNALAMSSVKVKERKVGNFNPSVIFQGKVVQLISCLRSEVGETPRFCQLYTLDPVLEDTFRAGNMSLPTGISRQEQEALIGLLKKLQTEINRMNPFARDFKMICEIPENELTEGKVVLSVKARPQGEHERQYNLQLCRTEVRMITDAGPHDLVLRVRGGGLQTVSNLNPHAIPLHFPLLFPKGTLGWHPELKRVGGTKRVSPRDWLAYYLNIRQDDDYLFRAGRLFQELICFGAILIEEQRLAFQYQNQKALRADTYKNVRETIAERRRVPLEDRMGGDTRQTIGKKVILARSFTKGPRWYNSKFQDGIAICRKYKKPDLFITFTCNPHWKEITDELKPGETAQDRPELVSRVFKMKKDLFVEDLVKNGIFGRMVAHLYVIEYQVHFKIFNYS